MRLVLDITNRLADLLPELSLPVLAAQGRKHVVHRQQALAYLILAAYTNTFRHKDVEDAEAYARDYLVRLLWCSKETYRQHLAPFFEFEEGNAGYSLNFGRTKAYTLRPHVVAALDLLTERGEQFPAYMIDDDGTRTAFQSLPANGVLGAVASAVFAPKVIPLDPSVVRETIRTLEQWRDKVGGHVRLDPDQIRKTSIDQAIRSMRVVLLWAIAVGGLPNLYVAQDNGRLGGVGLHVINLPRMVRPHALRGTGLVDYDIVGCHLAVLLSLALTFGVAAPTVARYVAERSVIHAAWAQQVPGTKADHYKPVVLSWLNGGHLRREPHNQNAERIGYEGLAMLERDTVATKLREEMAAIMEEARRRAPQVKNDKGKTVLYNAVGGAFTMEGRNQVGRANSHFLNGYEQCAIRFYAQLVCGLVAIVYDGFIAPAQDISSMVAAFNAQASTLCNASLTLSLKVEPFGNPQAPAGTRSRPKAKVLTYRPRPSLQQATAA